MYLGNSLTLLLSRLPSSISKPSSSSMAVGHGNQDDKVPIEIGREAAKCLDLLGANVESIEYEGLGHWYSPQMLRDIIEFLRKNLSTQS